MDVHDQKRKVIWFTKNGMDRLDFRQKSKKMRTNNGKIDDPKDHELRFYWKDSIDVIYLHSTVHGLPDDYGDEFIRDCIKDTEFPWEVWLNLLSNSD